MAGPDFKIKVGLLGYGSIGERHAINLEDLGQYVYVYEPKDHPPGVREWVIDKSAALVVCSPSKCHGKDLVDVVNAGKHVLVEKPIGYDSPPFIQGLLQGTRYKNPDLIIATGFNCRYHPCVKTAKAIMTSGILGKIKAAGFVVRQRNNKEAYLRDGLIRNWLSHEIDIAHHLLGEGTVEFCQAEDQVEATLLMKFDQVEGYVSIQGDYVTKPFQRYFWIKGSRGTIHANLETFEFWKNDDPYLDEALISNWDQTYIDEMQDFINSIRVGQHLFPLATGEDGCRALYTVMAARHKAGLEEIEYRSIK